MKPFVYLVLAALVAGAVVVGLRARSDLALLDELGAYHRDLHARALAPNRGVDAVPSEEDIAERLSEMAAERGIELIDYEVTITEGVTPTTGPAAMVADRMGNVAGQRDVDADGNAVDAPPGQLRTTVAEVWVAVRAKGFLCERETELESSRNYGYSVAP